MPPGERSTPMQKKVDKLRKNAENKEQGSTTIQKKACRPRNKVGGEQRTSFVWFF